MDARVRARHKQALAKLGISEEVAENLIEAGLETPRKAKAAAHKDLVKVKGVGSVLASQIRSHGQ